ncbi:LOW QUALITY PROTEIN: hypothetical protein OSB04_015796, partial [Centaurea solstitialis]
MGLGGGSESERAGHRLGSIADSSRIRASRIARIGNRIFRGHRLMEDIQKSRERFRHLFGLKKNGKRFGFIRFRVDGGYEDLRRKLSNVWIGLFKLHRENPKVVIRRARIGSPGVKSYKEAVCNGIHTSNPIPPDHVEVREKAGKESNFQEISFGSWEEDSVNSGFLKHCLVGSISSTDNIEAVSKLVSSIWEGSIVKYLGGKQVLIYLVNEDNIHSVESNPEHGIHYWVRNLCRWSKGYREVERITWLNVIGVPLHGWKEEIFTAIAGKWGRIIRTSNCNLLDDNVLNEGRILICTPIRTPIQEVGNTKIGQFFYRIVILEEEAVPICLGYSISEKADSEGTERRFEDSDTDSNWTTESNGTHISNTGDIRGLEEDEFEKEDVNEIAPPEINSTGVFVRPDFQT